MKIKNLTLKLKDKKFRRNLSYEEWLTEFISEPNDKELSQMEHKFCCNNPNFQPRSII